MKETKVFEEILDLGEIVLSKVPDQRGRLSHLKIGQIQLCLTLILGTFLQTVY